MITMSKTSELQVLAGFLCNNIEIPYLFYNLIFFLPKKNDKYEQQKTQISPPAWASFARWVTRLFTRFKVDAVSLCKSCPGWQRPTDGYVINSTWVIFPLHHTQRLHTCLCWLMNHFIDVTNISASYLWGEIMATKMSRHVLWSSSDSLAVTYYSGCSVYVLNLTQKKDIICKIADAG